ncbi:uncharacterized protein B0P05DRAFT_539229 [Gilbertella persicaria]|uniref:uncharacterized protein n=1 Tax=Gilbertella persicaria TaxID=101096 RepID=UPI00221F7D16|nr:uncharacterized protein B0P05DRAFT_539229 [Gilbertella persicaria]KAI8080699.1 hypothetical protein B0P05DRAFT_539229 [Gilbertella persicaria]
MHIHHDETLLKELQAKIDQILNDELLDDVPTFPTIEEIEALIAVEKGQAYNIKIERDPLPPLYIIVRQSSTVSDIKGLIKTQVERMEKEQTGRIRKISWKSIWHSHCLLFEQHLLLQDHVAVSQLGIKQNSVLKFSRLAHEKGHHRKARRH